ncbi:uncharacterized protein MONBRDRAFT_12126 [Monosiga brevicollis MX1]|uniref:Amine oxidase domain-containing protein n=1 Tax=Monosiga brevicollis TaxID=81824 RepID=A9VBA7_MONBE|nr:uncharacterized protein MONBRDRAFT_12126 [Monosiga brevicollis MX1]EDQ85204.1 predicted protein [Monosiga brevicollis MX1]|eukprot:XP_001750029.1 hypothetical protein [Monosiga brevicollis MX1]
MTVLEYLQRQGASEHVQAALDSLFANDRCSHIEAMGLHEAILAEQGAPVASVKYDALTGCTLVLANGARHDENQPRTYHAQRVIVTVSLGVLKANHIVFDPPLPEPKREAICRLQFKTVDGATIIVGFVCARDPASTAPGCDCAPQSPTTCVACRPADFDEAAWSDLTPEQQRLFSYSSPSLDACSAQYRKALAAPVADRLFWAGEATSDIVDVTIQAAAQSGRRAVSDICSHLASL